MKSKDKYIVVGTRRIYGDYDFEKMNKEHVLYFTEIQADGKLRKRPVRVKEYEKDAIESIFARLYMNRKDFIKIERRFLPDGSVEVAGAISLEKL